jgi:hypothetical protein
MNLIGKSSTQYQLLNQGLLNSEQTVDLPSFCLIKIGTRGAGGFEDCRKVFSWEELTCSKMNVL